MVKKAPLKLQKEARRPPLGGERRLLEDFL